MLAVLAIVATLASRPTLPSSTAMPSPTRAAHPSSTGAREGVAGGSVPDGTTAFDSGVPGVARLRPALLRSLRRAATDAGSDGVELEVNSGWRSAAYEDRLRQEAVARYGSAAEAARWVATGSTSPHVTGDAVDIGPPSGAMWLATRGAAYGPCRVYANEPWHYELRSRAAAEGCPGVYADPTHDPRLQR